MTTIDLLPTLGELTADKAGKWVAALLAEAAALRAYEATYFPNSDEPREVAASERVHAAIRDWSRRATLLQAQLAALDDSGRAAANGEELARAMREFDAVTCFSPESQARAIMQVRRGQTIPGDQVREQVRQRRAELDRRRAEARGQAVVTGSAA